MHSLYSLSTIHMYNLYFERNWNVLSSDANCAQSTYQFSGYIVFSLNSTDNLILNEKKTFKNRTTKEITWEYYRIGRVSCYHFCISFFFVHSLLEMFCVHCKWEEIHKIYTKHWNFEIEHLCIEYWFELLVNENIIKSKIQEKCLSGFCRIKWQNRLHFITS